MVEFSVMAPIALALIFGTVNGGLLLYQINAANHTASVGAGVIAAQGSATAADSAAIARMRTVGLGFGASAQEFDVYMLQPDGSGLRDTDSCGGTPCAQRYTAAGQLIAGNWDPSLRNVTNLSSSFAELDIQYTWHYLFGTGPAISLTATRVIRLEPQT